MKIGKAIGDRVMKMDRDFTKFMQGPLVTKGSTMSFAWQGIISYAMWLNLHGSSLRYWKKSENLILEGVLEI